MTPGREPDTYTARQAARLLGVSERRVRQLVAEGRIPRAEGPGPLRVPALAVVEARKARQADPRVTAAAALAPDARVAAGDPDALRALVAALVAEMVPRAIEAAEVAHRGEVARLADELAAERAARVAAEERERDLLRELAGRGPVHDEPDDDSGAGSTSGPEPVAEARRGGVLGLVGRFLGGG